MTTPSDDEVSIAQSSLRLRGTIRLPPDGTHPTGRRIVIQGATEDTANAHDAAGLPIMIYEAPVQTYSRTSAQEERRFVLTEATDWYRASDSTVRGAYNDEAQARKITVWNVMMSVWLLAHITITRDHWDHDASHWDSGATWWRTWWDAGASLWDTGLSQWYF